MIMVDFIFDEKRADPEGQLGEKGFTKLEKNKESLWLQQVYRLDPSCLPVF